MKKTEFVGLISEFCEFEGGPYTPETELQSIDGYDSLAVLSMIAFIDENFSVKLTGEQFIKLTDFNSLITAIGVDKFEDD